jgi:hypothetical protein
MKIETKMSRVTHVDEARDEKMSRVTYVDVFREQIEQGS